MSRWILLLFALLGACAPGVAASEVIVLASTTSTQDSGLLDALTEAFENGHPGLRVKVVAVGSGEALDLGRRGDADVLLVHSPQDEVKFMAQGHGLSRTTIMRNDFVVAGPRDDPALVRGSSGAAEAFTRIARSSLPFISRGDESGTHRRELSVWDEAGIAPGGDWYYEAGAGMAETLVIAAEKSAYILTDSATLRTTRPSLESLFSKDKTLVNVYSVIPVASARSKGAGTLAQWLVSPESLTVIGSFGKDGLGISLFEPVAQ